ncbi:cytochrome P450 [Dendrothele bispora CBS 962.96]|uniref:Cytochrome P450 n=1 Tax=Dendrothele bispora (strain CBS 962.96) TaxID=1314807 RepID=A0A4S8L4E8_DENBC|nr:cytochrome P450 [Dendrothele bispora CBS 962.96]
MTSFGGFPSQQLSGPLSLSTLIPIPFVIAASLFCYTAFNLIYRHVLGQHTKRPPYPPGPPSPSFFLGHYGKMPMKKPWFDYMEMEKTYGELIYFRSLWDHIVIINSAQATNEIMEKQARITSDRPFGTALDKFTHWDKNLSLSVYSDMWRYTRRIFHQNFRSEAAVKFHPVQIEKVHCFLRSLLELSQSSSSDKQSHDHSDELVSYISTLSQGIMIKSVYGIEIQSAINEEVPIAAKEFADLADQALLPGGATYRSIPFIHLLAWLVPDVLSEFARAQKRTREITNMLSEGPFEEAMKAWKSGNQSSLVGELMSQGEGQERSVEEVDRIKCMGSTAIAAAADTTASATATFFLALILYPEVQSKAQEELDRVLGPGRIPNFKDRQDLPYVEAIYREVMRWHPALPMGFPHKSTEDMIYKGCFIPKGAILHANVWAITHNPDHYTSPDKFIPERYLNKDGSFNKTYAKISTIDAYGYGRRVCVGRHVADATLWLAMASVLATMNVSRVGGDESEVLDIEKCYTDFSLCHPHMIPGCKVEPRLSKTEFEMALEQAKNEY